MSDPKRTGQRPQPPEHHEPDPNAVPRYVMTLGQWLAWANARRVRRGERPLG